MTRLAVRSLAAVYHTNCRRIVSFFQARQSLVMFFMGVALLFGGLEMLADAQTSIAKCADDNVDDATAKKFCKLGAFAANGNTTGDTIKVNKDDVKWSNDAYAATQYTFETFQTSEDPLTLSTAQKPEKTDAYPHNMDLGWYVSLVTTKRKAESANHKYNPEKLLGDAENLKGKTVTEDGEIQGLARSLKGVNVPTDNPSMSNPIDPDSSDVPYDDTLVRNSVGNLYKFIEGAFGALLVVATGIGTIIAAVVGAYKAAFALFVTSVGAFILRSYVSLFFGTDYVDYDGGLNQ